MGSRYRLAPRQDDLRFVEKRPGAWDSSVVEDEDDDLTDSTASEAEVQSSRDSWTWAPEPGPGQYEEFYGPIGANKWKAKWWNPSAGLPQQNHRRATIQAEIAELVASGQPKEIRNLLVEVLVQESPGSVIEKGTINMEDIVPGMIKAKDEVPLRGLRKGLRPPLQRPASIVMGTRHRGKSSVGDAPDPKGPGDEGKAAMSGRGKVSSSYPPIFRAKAGESYRDWRRALEFWLGGEGNQIPEELIGPRIMVQLRDRAAQLVKHLNNSDVNRVGGKERIFEVLEKSPLVRQLDKHRIDQQRKKLMALHQVCRRVVGDADGEGSGLLVGTFRRLEAKDARPSGASIDVSSEPSPDWGGGSQTGGAGSPVLEDDDVLVETEGGLVAENDTEDYDAVGSDVREELYAMEDLYVDEGDWEGIYKEDKDAYFLDRRRPGAWEKGRPARGVTQKLKKGVQQGIRLMERLKRGAQVGEKFMVLEVFSGSSMLTLVAAESDGWGAYQPVDVILSDDGDMSKKANRDKVKSMVRVMKPDLVVITPPCGPWCAWQRTCRDWDALDETRKEHLPFWRMTREIWDIQTRGGRLCLTEQPEGSEALETEYMSTRDSLYRVTVDQCMFGLNDPASHKLYRKATNLDVNDQAFAVGLAGAPRCNHSPLDHEQIRGRMQVGGKWESRSAIAARWTRSFAKYILKAAQICLAGRPLRVDDDPLPVDRSPSPGRGGWPVYPIEVEEGVLSPEEVLKRQMKQMGAEGERYDYVVFEGDARMLPRRTRATLAHLHVVLGHLSNERLHRMVSLAGGNADLLCGVRNMRCQICSMVRPPGSKPQVSYLKPTNFNQRVSGDVVFVWDVKNVKYAIVHYIDELTDYHVGALEFDPTSEWAAEVLCRLWYDVFGPPDVLITDGGTEFQGSLGRLNDLFAVQHEVVPDQAKWRLGHAERHGAVVKVMMMKVVTELQIDNLRDMQCALSSCFAAKNRIIGQSGVAPLQAVTGRSNPLPGSLLAQITSGKVKFKANEDLILDEALRRGERIRAAAIEACHWLDAHEGLRRALASRSRPPALELIREGATVYVYDPPANRRGLARRLQDNISWSGPAVVVCVERDGTTPKKVWVRVRTRVKAYPLEKIRLATADEMLSADFIVGALKDVEGELAGGKMEVLDYIEKKDDPSGEVEGEDAKARGTPPPLRLDPEAERKREIKHDVPEALRAGQEEEPHLMPFKKKQKLFEQLAKDLGAPTAMQEAAVRERLESAYGQLKKVRKEWKKESKEKSRQASRAGGASASARGSSVPPGKDSLMVEPMVPSEWMALWSEVETHALLWETESDDHPYLKKIIDMAEGYAAGEMKAVLEAELVTGKLGVEYQWRNLDENWRRAYEEPLIKAVQVYFDHDAIAGVAKDAIVDPRKRLKFGKHRMATEGWQKFYGGYEKQDPETYEFLYTMEEYITKIPDIEKGEWDPKLGPLKEKERLKIGSILGQVNWAARQGRYNLSYGVSHCQQLAGASMREAMEWTAKLLTRAKKDVVVRVPRLGCDLENIVVISASNAAFAAQPKGHSQGSLTCMVAHPNVLKKKAPVAILEAQSMKIQRVVRYSISAELSMAAESFEHRDFIRAMLAETIFKDFDIRR
eukprot:g27278.t1